MTRWTGFLGLALAMCLAGCGGPTEKKASVAPYEPPKPAAAPEKVTESADSREPIIPPKPPAVEKSLKGAGAAKETLRALDLAGFEKVVAEQKGKWVAVDCWATWCIPCRAKFPKYAELAKKSPAVVFVTLSFDEPEQLDEAADFLGQHPGKFIHLRLTEEIQTAQEKLNFEGIPRYFLFDPSGKLVVNTDNIDKLAEALAKQFKS